ncbi:MAG: hypothetical protein IPN17_17970 [Deltaproteobacteria bacterium]|nr:hypothetical protein [Deltaproteobacteria bacterium]
MITAISRTLSPSAPSGERAGACSEPGCVAFGGSGGVPGEGSGRRARRRGSIGGAPRFTFFFLIDIPPLEDSSTGATLTTGAATGAATFTALVGFAALTAFAGGADLGFAAFEGFAGFTAFTALEGFAAFAGLAFFAGAGRAFTVGFPRLAALAFAFAMGLSTPIPTRMNSDRGSRRSRRCHSTDVFATSTIWRWRQGTSWRFRLSRNLSCGIDEVPTARGGAEPACRGDDWGTDSRALEWPCARMVSAGP